ncbi:MAG: V-type ATP synthase subunit I [Coriobacteriia bacterium]|nr:V-type ATP synthase subunit I [Coriobacteriia bacterium]
MAVAPMLKVTVLAHQSVMDDLVGRMQRAGVLAIDSAPAELPGLDSSSDEDRLHRLEEYLADATFVRDFLGRYHVSGQPFGAFVSEKIHIDVDEFHSLSADAAMLQLYRECEEISSRSATLQRERTRLLHLAEELLPWENLHLQISRWLGTEHMVLFTGIVPASDGAAIRQALRETASDVTVEELQSVNGRAAWVVMAHRAVVDAVRATLALTNFQEVGFPDLEDYPAEERAEALERADDIAEELARLDEAAQNLAAANHSRCVAVVEAVASELDSVIVRGQFGATERTFAIGGWVRASQREELEAVLEPLADEVDVSFAEPADDDKPPVVLDNLRIIRPFETLTDLYGLPKYGEVDPTPLLAPFFLLFFSLCICDVGYGLMLIAGAWYIKNKIDVAPGVKRFMDLLMYGGAGAMVAGVLFGSYFALDFKMVAGALPFLEPLQVIDPLIELPKFLIFTIVLGVIQVFFGILISAWDLARHGDRRAAFFDQFSTILMFASIGVAAAVPALTMPAIVLGVGVTAVFKGRAIEAALGRKESPGWDRALGISWLVAVLVTLVTWATGLSLPVGWVLLGLTLVGLAASKTVRRSVVALLGGMYAVYSMTSFIGDILSYTRLAALGLSGMLVGMVFNTLAGLVMGGAGGLFASGGLSVVGGIVVVLLGSLVFAVGHTFNVVISLLGAFVHPARLQFVEFFSKFYEGGGRPFKPFAHRTKSLVLHAGGARQEGAGS